MSISIFPVTASFAAEIGDIDLSQALEAAEGKSDRQTASSFQCLGEKS